MVVVFPLVPVTQILNELEYLLANSISETIGIPDDLKGESVVAFVSLETGSKSNDELITTLKKHVSQEIGAIARPDEIRFTNALPKTRSGKIMRRLLRALASGEEVKGDTSTLEDRNVLDELRK